MAPTDDYGGRDGSSRMLFEFGKLELEWRRRMDEDESEPKQSRAGRQKIARDKHSADSKPFAFMLLRVHRAGCFDGKLAGCLPDLRATRRLKLLQQKEVGNYQPTSRKVNIILARSHDSPTR